MRVRHSSFLLLFVSCSLFTNASLATSFEPRLIESLDALQNKTDVISESKLSSLIQDYPNSQTAHLLMADVYAARAGVIDQDSLRKASLSTASAQQLGGLRDELNLRWNQVMHASPAQRGLVPSSIIKLAPKHHSVVFIDASQARLYIYNNKQGELSLALNNYTSIGEQGQHKRIEGDKRTPIGVYNITRYIEDNELPPLYGSGAFPINYPNSLDKHYNRTGYGIWLHGTHPESFNRVPLASDGCVAMSNPEFDLIKPLVSATVKTPVIISDQPNWVEPKLLDVTRAFFLTLLDQWAKDWASLDTQKYSSHYDQDSFFTDHDEYTSWIDKKIKSINRKESIEINLSSISIFAYPAEKDMIIAEFTQGYKSNSYISQSLKRQYWKRSINNEWKIIYEGNQQPR